MAEITLKPQTSALMPEVRPAWQRAALIVGCSLFVAVCAHLSVPLFFTPVPLSLAPMAVLMVGLGLAPAEAAACLALYLLEGAAGLPVFSPTGPAGYLHLIGPTGGYLMSYPAAAALASWLYRRYRQTFTTAAVAAALASFVILAAGAAWLGIVTNQDARHIIPLAVTPFLPGDALKICFAAASVTAWRRLRPGGQHREETL